MAEHHPLFRVLATPISRRVVRVLATFGGALLVLELVLTFRLWRMTTSLDRAEGVGARLQTKAMGFSDAVHVLAKAQSMDAPKIDFASAKERRAFREFLAARATSMSGEALQFNSSDGPQSYFRALLDRIRNSPIWLSDPSDPWRPEVRLVPLLNTRSANPEDGVALIQVDRVSKVYVDSRRAKTFDDETFGTVANEVEAPGYHSVRVETREGQIRSLEFPILERTLSAVELRAPLN